MVRSYNEKKEHSLLESRYVLRDSHDVSILSFSNNTVLYPNKHPLHVHSILEISLIKDGSGTYSIGDKHHYKDVDDIDNVPF